MRLSTSALYIFGICFHIFLLFAFSEGDVKEPSTGIAFPPKYKDNKLSLAGVGVRLKTIGPIKAKVYAVGIYANKDSVVKKLKDLKPKSADDLLKIANFPQEALGGPAAEKVFELRMARNVGTETMVDALKDAVAPRIGSDKSVLKSFENVLLRGLQGKGASKGTVLSFEAKNDLFSIKIDGVKAGDISSSELSKAFAGVYLDKATVSPTVRQDVASTVFSWQK